MKPQTQRLIIRIALPLLSFLFLAILGSYFFRYPGVNVSPFEAVSKQSGFLLGASGSLRMLHDSLPPSALPFPDLFQRSDLQNDWNAWHSLWRSLGRERRSGLQPRQALVSLHPVAADQLGLLFIIDARKLGELQEYLQTQKPSQSQFRNQPLYQLPPMQGHQISYTVFRNLLLVSTHPFLIEEAVDQLRDYREARARAGELDRMRRRLPGSELALYLAPGTLPAQFSAWLEPTQAASTNDWFRKTGNWVALSTAHDSTRLLLDGIFSPGQDNALWSGVQAQSPRNWQAVLRVLPDHTAGLFWLGFNRPRHAASALRGATTHAFKKLVLPWMEGEMAWVQLETFGGAASETTALLLRVREPETADRALKHLAGQLGELQEYEYQTYRILQIQAGDLLPHPFRAGGAGLQAPYCARLEDYVIFAGSRSALEVVIDKFIVGQTLENMELLQSLGHDLPPKLQALLWADWAALEPGLQQAFRSTALPAQLFSANSGRLLAGLLSDRKGFQVRASRERPGNAGTQRVRIAWKCSLQSDAAIAPVQVPNGQGGFDYLIQDIENRLYRIQANGQLVWKRSIEGRIQSNIHAIDYYGNGQVQYLFNTDKRILLLDQDGQSVSTFPINLQSPASNGVAVVDFGNHRDLAFFIACQNGNVYGYNRTGVPLEGWRPKEIGGRILQPLRHFQHANQDYLVLLEKSGRLFAFGRNGESRFPAVSLSGTFLEAPAVQEHPKYPRIAVADTKGKVHIVNTGGKSFFLQLLSSPGSISEFALAQVCGDERLDYVSLAGDQLQISYYEGEDFKTWRSVQLPFPHDEVFVLPGLFGNTDGIGLLSIDKKRVTLLSKEGQLLPGFSLAGTSQFCAGQLPADNSRMLVVANDSALYAYRF